jgi:hypothetical protein
MYTNNVYKVIEMTEIEKQEEGVRTRAFYKAYRIEWEMNHPCP